MKGVNKFPMSGGFSKELSAELNKGLREATAEGEAKAAAGKAAGAQGLKTANNVNPKDKGFGHYIYKRSAETGEKFKDYSGWLYQMLFSIAITIAICMIILPSLCFVIITVICFFLLKIAK